MDELLSPEILHRLNSIEAITKWEYKFSEALRFRKITYNRFCEMLLNLSVSERALVIELVERYKVFTNDDYVHAIPHIFSELVSGEWFSRDKRYLLTPMITQKENDISSQHALYYNLSAMKSYFLYEHSLCNVFFCDNLKALLDKNREDDIIVLIDDFVGSGCSILKARSILDTSSALYSRIIVCCIVCHSIGFDLLFKNSIPVVSKFLTSRGISDYYKEPELTYSLELMKGIEDKMSVTPDYLLGYGSCEALISMVRTPNNTLPIFWKNTDRWKAPFER